MGPQEIQILEPLATPVPGRLAMRFRVPKSLTRQRDMPTPNETTFSACTLPNKIRVDEFGSYLFIKDEEGPSGYHEFIFAPALTREQVQTPYRSYYETEPSMFWPKVWISSKNYRRVDNDQYSIKSKYREAYQGPTRVLIEEFYSPTPFEIPVYEPMSDGAVNEEIGREITVGSYTYWWSFGTFVVEQCLHPAFAIVVPISPSITVNSVTYSEAYATADGTTMEDWPETLVVDDRQREILGGWVRRRVTALRPMIIRVTLPTSASIASTTATLGGTLAVSATATVISRGVVLAPTSLDANPEVGNSQVTSFTLAGATTGAFTVSVTGLTASTAYSFKPWALSGQGVRVYGPVGTFTTSA
jgi:hypothetical protein